MYDGAGMNLVDVILLLMIYIFGTLLSLVITGFLVNKLVIRKIMANPDVQDILKLIKEGKDYLKEIVENQNHDK